MEEEEEKKLSDVAGRDEGLLPYSNGALFTPPLRTERRGEVMEAQGLSIRL